MLGNLISEIDSLRKESLSLIENLPTVELDEDEQCSFELFFKKQNLGCICTSQSFQVETSENHWAVCSNQYLALAAIGFDFAMCLKKYFDFFDACIRNNKNESDKIVDLQNAFPKACLNDLDSIDDWLNSRRCMSYLTHIANHPEDKESLCYFLSGIGTKKFGNEKKALRGTGDLFGAYVLAVFPVTTVASGFLGGLIYALTQDSEVFGKIVTSFKKAKERQNKLNKEEKKNIFEGISSFSPSQVIYYGVPGSGKSNKIKELLKDVPDERKERVVFHPEYTNADFVGQILPVVHNGVDYKFSPGPFTKMVAKAYKSLASENPEQFYLVIEEINRGNAAAIFGDVFQLLDRIKPGETDSSLGNGSVYTEGWSQYFVYNEDINSKILELAGVSELEMGSVKFTKDSGVRLPPNLSILATMNTSDQNVFTLDNAFQRRFAMKMIPNVLDESSAQYNMLIDGTGVCWGKFREWINKKVNEAPFAVSTEDKCLGGWFICGEKESEDKCRPFDKVEFAEKVLKYLWDDAFKRRRPDIFESNVKSLSDLISRFCDGDGFDSFTAVFKMNDADMAALKAVSLNPPAATAEPVTETA